ncbi:MAG: zinc-binding dehydrogenase [bacterium]|nr:zinc-binding dehydrogenase [bacterium]
MLPSTYKKLTTTRHSKNFREAVEILEAELPHEPAPDEIIIRNLYAGTNASDVMMAAGQYLLPTPVPCDMGAEAVGEVVAVGSEVTTFKPGDFALTNFIGAGYREYYVTQAKRAVPIPAASPEIMSLSIGGLTASIALETAGEMTSGEVVLVTAAAGGTGQFAVQLAKLAGNHVIGTCSSDDKAAMLTALGCDRVVNYKRENLRDVLKSEYPRGVHIVFESVGKEMYDAAVDSLARFGRLITLGFITEYKDQPDLITAPRIYYKVLAKNASIRGFNLNLWFSRPEVPQHMAKLIGLLDEGRLNAVIDPTEFRGVEGCIDAVEYLHSGQSSGKVVVRF